MYKPDIRFALSAHVDYVRLTWTELLPAETYDTLQRLLEAEYGVEVVDLTRYSARVMIAHHIASAVTVALEIEETLNLDREFGAALERDFASFAVTYLGCKS